MSEQVSDPYGFTPSFEAAVLRCMVQEPRFWGLVGKAVEVEAFSSEAARAVARAAAAVSRERGRGPGSGTIVVQRVSRWRDQGQVTQELLLDCDDLVGDLEDAVDPPDVDEVVAELLPVVKERRNREAVRLAVKTVSMREDMEGVVSHLQETMRLGRGGDVVTTGIGDQAFELVRELRATDRLSTGVAELDYELGGGPMMRTLNVFMGGTGDGKSMSLSHVAGSALIAGYDVLIATLELSPAIWSARLMANLTGVPIDAITDGSMVEECRERLAGMSLGRCLIGEFTAGAATVDDLVAWGEEVRLEENWGPRVWVVDYADLLGHSKSRDYEGMKEVYGGLREKLAKRVDGWCWTASASKRKDKQGAKQGVDDGADSQHKARTSDTWIVLTMSADGSEIEFRIAKNRGGRRGGSVTLPTELDCGRIAPISYGDQGEQDLF